MALSGEPRKLLEEGLVLARSTLTVGRIFKWAVIFVLALVVGFVAFYESVLKIWVWIQGPK